jgi:protoporphyrinogen/coproporphyrinogen III oxidase
MTAAIIGGGIAGLVAAYELTKAGERPYLIEPQHIGGVITSENIQGYTLETGPNVLVERPEIHTIVRELNLKESVVYPRVSNYGQYVWYNNKATKAPRGLSDLIASPLMSCASKVLLPFRMITPGVLPSREVDCSVRRFFTPLIGDRALSSMLDPVLKGIYGGDVERLSARSLFPNLWDAAKQKRSVLSFMMNRKGSRKPPVFVLKGGIETLTRAIWQHVQPHVQHISERVKRVVPLEGARYVVVLESGRRLEVDGCILATGGRATASIVPTLSDDLAQLLEQMRFAGLSVMHFAVPRAEPLIPDAFGVLFPGGMPNHLLGVMFNSILFPHVAPQDKHVLTVVLGGAQAGETVPDENNLRREVPQMLQRLLGIKTAEYLLYTHWSDAIPQLEVGHYEVVEQLDICEADHPGIVFAGVERGGIGVSDRIRVAQEAVARFRRMRIETVV